MNYVIKNPTDEEKQEASDTAKALSKHWRDIGLSVTLKAHVMEQYAVKQNNKYGLGDKEESYIEQGHQVGLKKNKRYQRITNFQKKWCPQ